MLFRMLICVALALPAMAKAAGDQTAGLRPTVFGTFGLTWHASDHLSYRRSLDQARGTRGGRLDTRTDSVLGVQLNARVNDDFDGVVQAVSRQNATGSWQPRLTWAFARFEPVEGFQLRLGRLGLDTMLGFDSRLIGYAYPAVRPSPEGLAMIPVDYLDGADLTLRHLVGKGLLQLKLFSGDSDPDVVLGGTRAELADQRINGLHVGYQGEHIHLRLSHGYSRSRDSAGIAPVLDALRNIPLPQTRAAADAYDMRSARSGFTIFDLSVDDGPLLFMTSLFRFRQPQDKQIIASQRGSRSLLLYRFGRWSPYVGYARMRTDRNDGATGLEGIPGLEPLQAALLEARRRGLFDQRSVSLGVRYDPRPGLALKAQVERVIAGQSPVVDDLRDTSNERRRLTLFSVALDFAFF